MSQLNEPAYYVALIIEFDRSVVDGAGGVDGANVEVDAFILVIWRCEGKFGGNQSFLYVHSNRPRPFCVKRTPNAQHPMQNTRSIDLTPVVR